MVQVVHQAKAVLQAQLVLTELQAKMVQAVLQANQVPQVLQVQMEQVVKTALQVLVV